MGPPLIYEIYRVYRGGAPAGVLPEAKFVEPKANEAELARLGSELAAVRAKEEYARKTLIESQAKWTNFCRNILAISRSLINSYGSAQPNAAAVLSDAAGKIRMYEQIMSVNESDLKDIEGHYSAENFTSIRPSPQVEAEAVPEEKLVDESQSVSAVTQQGYPMAQYVQFDRVKESLATCGDDIKLCALLQALRWRMTRTQHGEPRRSVMQGYIDHDLLACGVKDSGLLARLIQHKNQKYFQPI